MPFAVPPAITTRKPLFTPGMQVNWEHPINRDLAFWWLTNEGAGSVLNDVCRRIQPTDLTSHLWSISDGIPVMQMDATSDTGLTRETGIIGTATQWTLHAKLCINNNAGNGVARAIVGERSATSSGWQTRVISSGSGLPCKFSTRANGTGVNSTDAVIPHLTVCDLVYAYDLSAISFYLNGNFVETVNLAAATPQTCALEIGQGNVGPLPGVLAWYYSVSLFRRALSVSEVALLYANLYGTPDNPRLI